MPIIAMSEGAYNRPMAMAMHHASIPREFADPDPHNNLNDYYDTKILRPRNRIAELINIMQLI